MFWGFCFCAKLHRCMIFADDLQIFTSMDKGSSIFPFLHFLSIQFKVKRTVQWAFQPFKSHFANKNYKAGERAISVSEWMAAVHMAKASFFVSFIDIDGWIRPFTFYIIMWAACVHSSHDSDFAWYRNHVIFSSLFSPASRILYDCNELNE